MTDDPQDQAEALDEDVVGTHDDGSAEDFTGDEYGEGLEDYPPERPLGVYEDDVPDTLAERVRREVPEQPVGRAEDEVGAIVDPAGPVDHEERLLGDETDAPDDAPEEAAIHLDPD